MVMPDTVSPPLINNCPVVVFERVITLTLVLVVSTTNRFEAEELLIAKADVLLTGFSAVIAPAALIVNPDAPVEEATLSKSVVAADVPCTDNKATGVVVEPIPTFPFPKTVNKDVPVELLTWKGLFVPVPWTRKLIVDDVALTPATVPLSSNAPVESPDEEVQRAT